MADQVEPTPDPIVAEETYAVEIVEEGAPVDNTAELEAKVAELTAANAALASAPAAPADEGFAALAQELRAMKTPAPVPQQEAPVDYNQIVENVSKNFYGDPTKSVLELLNPVVTEMKKDSDNKLATQALQISKLTVLATDDDKSLYMKYKGEVDELATTLPPSENTYQQALDRIRVTHSKELIQEQVNAALEQATQAAEANAVQAQAKQAPVSLTTVAAKAPATSSRQLNAQQWRHLQELALIKGFELGTEKNLTADGVWAIERYKQLGTL